MKNFHTDFLFSEVNCKKYNNKIKNKTYPQTPSPTNMAATIAGANTVPLADTPVKNIVNILCCNSQNIQDFKAINSTLNSTPAKYYIIQKYPKPLNGSKTLLAGKTVRKNTEQPHLEKITDVRQNNSPVSQAHISCKRTEEPSGQKAFRYIVQKPKDESKAPSLNKHQFSNTLFLTLFKYLQNISAFKIFTTAKDPVSKNGKKSNRNNKNNQGGKTLSSQNEHYSASKKDKKNKSANSVEFFASTDSDIQSETPKIFANNNLTKDKKLSKNVNKQKHFHKASNAVLDFNDLHSKVTNSNNQLNAQNIPAKYFLYYLYLLSLVQDGAACEKHKKNNSISSKEAATKDNANNHAKNIIRDKRGKNFRSKTKHTGFPAKNNTVSTKFLPQSRQHKNIGNDSDIAKYYYALSLFAKSPLNNFVERFYDKQDSNEAAERLKNTCVLVDYIEQSGVSHAVMKDFMKVHFDYFGNYHQDAFESFRVLKNNVENQKQKAFKVINVLEHYKKKDNTDKDSAVKKLQKAFKHYGLDSSSEFKEYVDYLENIHLQNAEINKTLLDSVKQKSEKCDLNTLLEFICRYQNYGMYIEHLHEFVSLDKETKNSVYKKFVELHKNAPAISACIKDSPNENLQLVKANENNLDAPSKRQVKQINTNTYNTVEKLQQNLPLDNAVATACKLNNTDSSYIMMQEKEAAKDIIEKYKNNFKRSFAEVFSEEETQSLFKVPEENLKNSKNENIPLVSKNLTAKDIINKAVYLNDIEHKNNSVYKKAEKKLGTDLQNVKKYAAKQISKKQSERFQNYTKPDTSKFKTKEQPNGIPAITPQKEAPQKMHSKKQAAVDTKSSKQQTQAAKNQKNTERKQTLHKELADNKKHNGVETEIAARHFVNKQHLKKPETKAVQLKSQKLKRENNTKLHIVAPVQDSVLTQEIPCVISLHQPQRSNKISQKSLVAKAKRCDQKSKSHNDIQNTNNVEIQLQSIIKINQLLNQELNTKYGNQNKEGVQQYVSQMQFKRYQSEQKAADTASMLNAKLLNF